MPATRESVTAQDIEAARTERDRLSTAHEEALDSAQNRLTEMREANGGTLPATAEVRDEVREMFAEADQLGAQVDEANDHLATLQGRAYGTDPNDRMPAEEAGRRGHPHRLARGAGLPSLAGRMIDSEAYQTARDAGQLVGRQLGIELADVAETQALLAPALAATGLLDVVGDDFSRLFPPTGIPTQAPRFLDLISVTATGRDVVVYGVQTDETGNVTGAPPGTAFGRSTVTTERRTENIKRRGTLMDVFEDVLDDEPRMRSWLDPRLRRLVRLDAERQALFGDGVGQNYTGLTQWPGIGTRARGTDPAAVAIHNAMTDVRIAYHDEPDAIGFRPETWHNLLTARTADGEYINTSGPFGALPSTMWGKQTYTSTVFRDGTVPAGSTVADPIDCVVGYHPEAELVVRSGIELREFDQNQDNAETGLITLRVQHRSTFIINQPLAFVLLDLT